MKKTDEKKVEKKTFKEKVKEEVKVWKLTFNNIKNDLSKNPEKIGGIIGGAITLGVGIYGLVMGAANRSEENCRIHDEMTGFDWVTDHPLTNQELLEVNRRLYEGQVNGLGEALKEEGYLKDEKKRK